MQAPPQPDRFEPFLTRRWLQRYDGIRLTRTTDAATLDLPVSSSILSFLDYNPRWLIDHLVSTGGKTLFTLGLDLTNSCTDACPMCFTMDKRMAEGLQHHLDIGLTLRRMAELRETYPDTFRLVMMAGSGEPLNLPGIEDLLDGVFDLGLTIRVTTAGKKLRMAQVRRALLRCAIAVRVSVDAIDEDTFILVHAATGLAERLDSIRHLVADRNTSDSTTLIGMHFVIQKANYRQILPFANLAQTIGCDFVSFSQETYGNVAGGFTEEEFGAIVADLAAVEDLHNDAFGVMVPTLTHRPTVLSFDKTYLASPEVLDRCHHSRQHVFFGVLNDFAACCLAGMDADFKKASYIGRLDMDVTMAGVDQVIQAGVGSALGRGAQLSCNSCMMNGYNKVVDEIFTFLDGCPAWDCELLAYQPGKRRAQHYELVMSGQDGLSTHSAPAGGPA
jgi:molybdenum cofactor biosynthesis enzyme MoaA